MKLCLALFERVNDDCPSEFANANHSGRIGLKLLEEGAQHGVRTVMPCIALAAPCIRIVQRAMYGMHVKSSFWALLFQTIASGTCVGAASGCALVFHRVHDKGDLMREYEAFHRSECRQRWAQTASLFSLAGVVASCSGWTRSWWPRIPVGVGIGIVLGAAISHVQLDAAIGLVV